MVNPDSEPLRAGTPGDGSHGPTLMERIRTGDRAAAAEFITLRAPLIRRRFRGKIARSLRTIFDSDDLLATLSRRFDDLVRRRELTATSEAQIWALLARIATIAVSEHARRDLKGPHHGGDVPPLNAEPKPDELTDPLLASCLAELTTEIDQRTLRMRLDDRTHAQIAASEGVTVETARKRWQRVRGTVRSLLEVIGMGGSQDQRSHHVRPRGVTEHREQRPDT